MRTLLICIILFVCALPSGRAQTNYVRNPSFERYDTCPTGADQLKYAIGWRGIIDSLKGATGEACNECGNSLSIFTNAHIPYNARFWQYPHSGKGFAGGLIGISVVRKECKAC